MDHYDIYRDQLFITHPSFGHALWDPAPGGEYGPVKIGDVGFVREGRFVRLFNALLPADDPSHKETPLPEHHEPLIPNFRNHIYRGTPLMPSHYCSAGVNIAHAEPDCLATGPEGAVQASFSYRGRRGGAVLSIPVEAQRQDTHARGDFGKWMLKHIDRWFAFARGLGLGIGRMDEIILVTGCDCTRSWANVTFLEGRMNGQASFGVRVDQGSDVSVNWQLSSGRIQGAVCNWGPGGKNLPEDQCIFIRGFRVARVLDILPKQPKGAAGPNSSPEGDHDGDEPDKESISIPAFTKYRDPLHVLLNYIVERVPDCAMVLVHDDDLVHVSGFGDRKEFLLPDVLMDHLKTYPPEIQQIMCDLLTDEDGLETSGGETRSVAMFSEEFRGWSVIPPQQLTISFGQSHPCRPDQPTNDVFTFASPRKHPSGDYRTLGARREGASRGVTQLPSQVLAGVLDMAARMMKYPISITLAIIACAYTLAIMSDPIRSALAPMCSVPVVSLVCLAPAGPSRPSNPECSPLWANFRKLVKVESEALEFFIDETVEVFALALEIEKAGMTASDLATRVRVSNMDRREILVESLGEFEKGARKVSHGLTRFIYRVGSSVDRINAVNNHVLNRIEAAHFKPSSSGPSEAATEQVVTRTFTEVMNVLSANMEPLILGAKASISDLNKLEKHLKSIDEVVSRGDWLVSSAKNELFAQPWAILGGNVGQLTELVGNLASLKGVRGYRDDAPAHVVATLQMLESMAKDMNKLRIHATAPDLVDDPIHVHIKFLRDYLKGLRGRRTTNVIRL